MDALPTAEHVAQGKEALAVGDWETARQAFESALRADPSAEALDGLGRTLWWLGDVDGAIECRERAYAILRKRGDTDAAALIALWLSREYLEAIGNEPASQGWLVCAQGLLRDAERAPANGWLRLTPGRRAFDAGAMEAHAEAALDIARNASDVNLEASALALLGRARLLAGEDTDVAGRGEEETRWAK